MSTASRTASQAVTVLMATVVALSFLFSFGNVWALGIRLGVAAYVAPLVAPAVDLSVVGLLVGTRELARRGASAEQIRPARRFLAFSSVVTLALNIAEPLIAGQYGRAAFDSVGCWLLIGWAEVGPNLVRAMQNTASGTAQTGAQMADASVASKDRRTRRRVPVAGPSSPAGGSEARRQDLLHRARAEDVLHWQQHQRPISAENLRKRLRVGAGTARGLVAQLRSDTHVALDGVGEATTT